MFEVPILIITASVNLLLALFVLSKNTRSATNWLFAALATILGTEPIVNYFSLHSSSHLIFIRLVMFMVIYMGLLFWWMSFTYPRTNFTLSPRRWLELIFTILVSIVALSPWLFSGISIDSAGEIHPIPGPGMALFILQTIYTIGLGIFYLFRRHHRSQGLEKVQLEYMVLGTSLAFGLAIFFDLVVAVFLHDSQFVSFTPVFLSLFAVFISIGIVRHRLFNIRLIIARSVAYTLLLATLAGIYALAAFGATSLFFHGNEVSNAQNLIYIALAVILAFTFQPLRRFFEKLTDRIFYRDRYDSQAVLNAVGKILAEEILLDRLLAKTLGEICRVMRVESGQFMIFDQGQVYKFEHFGPVPKQVLAPAAVAKLHQGVLVADELNSGELKNILDEHAIRVSLMLRTKDEFVGHLFLGDKLSGDIYSTQDLRLLEILSQELSIAIVNAKAYEEIQQFNVTLQQKIKEATAELRTANKNLKALDKTKDEFLSMASHQLRTPLTTIKGYLSMLEEGDAGKITAEQKEFLDYAVGGAERMVGLISDLLNVSRLSSGKFVIDKTMVDLTSVVQDEIRQLLQHAEQKQLKLTFVPPKTKLPKIELDEGKTRQVIMNYIDNAIYYTKAGSVTVALDQDGDNARLRVTDTGIGVPPEEQKKLFAKFYRAENAQNVRPDGTGLGLYLAKQVIETQGGKIIFESTLGKGSTFGFELPLKQ